MDLAQYTWTVVPVLAALTMLGHAIIVALAGVGVYELFTKKRSPIHNWFGKNGLILMLIVSTVATLGSLYFSEYVGWAPCKYCWIQRIFMYPVVFMLAIALWKRDRNVARYILALSLIGGAYGAYHYYIQMYDIIASPLNPATPCDASGESCVKTPFVEFGYITVPMMALTAFTLNALGSWLVIKNTALPKQN